MPNILQHQILQFFIFSAFLCFMQLLKEAVSIRQLELWEIEMFLYIQLTENQIVRLMLVAALMYNVSMDPKYALI